MQDHQIIMLYNARDERAIEQTAQKYGGYCTSIAQNILHNMQDSEECVNDTWLQTGAFRECKRVRYMTLPHGLQSMGSDVFELCDDLQALYYEGTAEEWESVEMTDLTREQLAALIVFADE